MTTQDDSGTHATLAGQDDTSDSPDLPRGSNLGRYVIIEPIGSGGMGTVYRAYDPQLNRGVALKILSVKQEDQQAAERAKARLIREAQALAQLSHPSVVAVHDAGTFEDDVFIAMELVEGKTVDEWMKEKKRVVKEILEVMIAAGRGLSAAHKAGLVHRDFKPGNVIVGDDGRVRVLDFGLARAADQTELVGENSTLGEPVQGEIAQKPTTLFNPKEISSNSSPNLLQSPLTNAGGVLGTPLYMAPEQHLGLKTDERTDQFGFCVVLYEALYGKRPFIASTREKLKSEVIRQQVCVPRADTEVPAWLWQIVRKGLSAKPEDRYTNIDSLLEDLEHDPEEVRRQQLQARRRTLLVVSIILMTTAIPVGVWYEFAVRRSELCKNGPQEIAKVWNVQVKTEVHEALVATGISYARDTAARVVSSFVAYADGWVKMFTQTCRATRVGGDQSVEVMDLRMICLHQRRKEMQSLVEVISKSDAKMVEKAAQAAASLTSLDRCADVEALKATRELMEPPPNEEVARSVDEIRNTLTKVGSLQRLGKYADGMELAEDVLKPAKSLDYLPIEAEALYWVGLLHERLGHYKEAAATLRGALEAASCSFHHEKIVKSATDLLWVVGVRLAKHEEGLRWSRLAKSAERRAKVGGEQKAERLKNMGIVFHSQGEYDKALEAFRKSIAINEKALGPEHPNVAAALGNIGNLLAQQLENKKALGYYRKSLAIFEKVLGAEHPSVAQSLSCIGVVFLHQGEYKKALEHSRRALEIWEKVLGAEHPYVAYVLNNIGNVFLQQGEYKKALEYFPRALEILKKALGAEHPDVARSLSNIGILFERQGEYERALEYHRRALAIREKALGPEHSDVATVVDNMGIVFKGQREYNQALAYFRRALVIREKALGPEHPRVAATLGRIGTIFMEQTRYHGAHELLERALDICEKKTCEREPHGQALFSLAQSLVATDGDKERAITLASQAREIYHKTPKRFKKELKEVNTWLQNHGASKLAKRTLNDNPR